MNYPLQKNSDDSGNLTYTCNHETMASIFNNYFVSIGKKLASTILPRNINAYPVVCSGHEQSFVLYETFTQEVIAEINSSIESKSTRQKDIPIHNLKSCKKVLSPFLDQIFNLCIMEGIYPQSLKVYRGWPNSWRRSKRWMHKLQTNIPTLTNK